MKISDIKIKPLVWDANYIADAPILRGRYHIDIPGTVNAEFISNDHTARIIAQDMNDEPFAMQVCQIDYENKTRKILSAIIDTEGE